MEDSKDLKTLENSVDYKTRGRGEKSLPTQFNFLKEKLMIFIDGGNLFGAVKEKNIKIDFRKLADFLAEGFNLIRVYYYTGVPTLKSWDKSRDSKKQFKEKISNQIKFLDGLEFNYNFHVVKKPLSFDKGFLKEKGVDVNIASDIIWHGLSDNYDSFILISGDRDLMDCLMRMKDNGKKVIVANFENRISREIKKIADKYINLSDYLEEIKRNY